LTLPAATKIFLCTEVADMRRGFDGLAAMTREIIGADPLSGHLFVFRNRRRDRMKVLYWDRDGFALWYKRLERGTFRFPAPRDGAHSVEVDHATLTLILEGIDVRGARRQQRFQRTSRLTA
jgi:transposase